MSADSLNIVKTEVSPVAPARNARLPEIDIFRALAISLMGVTHGYFQLNAPPFWATLVTNIGIYFCFAAFLFSFGLSQGLTARRGSMEKPGARLKTLRRAGIILIAYYIIAIGKILPDLRFYPGNRAAVVLEMVTLWAVPKTADFFLAFVFYLMIILLVGRHIRRVLAHPVLLLAAAFGLHFIGVALSVWHVQPDGYWKILFGAPDGSRTFPILPYFPLWVLGLLLGDFYAAPGAMGRKQIIFTLIGLFCLLMAGGDFIAHAQMPLYLMGTLYPVPHFFYLFGAAAVSLILFLLCAVIVPHAQSRGAQFVQGLLVYIGQNSIWIIVCQYFWIQLSARILHLGNGGTLRIALFGVTMIFVPPLLLASLQRLQTVLRPQKKSENPLPNVSG